MSKGYDRKLEENPDNDPSNSFVAPFAWGLLICLVALIVGVVFRSAYAKTSSSHEDFTGTAKIVDGDTLDIGRLRIRLHGIDAPEAGQKCKKPNGGNWPCGKESIKAIAKLANGKRVHCVGDTWDDFGRFIGTCSVGSLEINREMVRLGLAWNFDKYSMIYKPLEKRVRKARTGVFRAPTMTPWEYRAQRWKVAEQVAPKGCPIKGNISRKGRIYHAPWSRWYKRTKISTNKGERWFCSEAEAIKAGWREPYWK